MKTPWNKFSIAIARILLSNPPTRVPDAIILPKAKNLSISSTHRHSNPSITQSSIASKTDNQRSNKTIQVKPIRSAINWYPFNITVIKIALFIYNYRRKISSFEEKIRLNNFQGRVTITFASVITRVFPSAPEIRPTSCTDVTNRRLIVYLTVNGDRRLAHIRDIVITFEYTKVKFLTSPFSSPIGERWPYIKATRRLPVYASESITNR